MVLLRALHCKTGALGLQIEAQLRKDTQLIYSGELNYPRPRGPILIEIHRRHFRLYPQA